MGRRLRLIAPVIVTHGIKYEQDKFIEKLENGSLTLVNTKLYMQGAIKMAIEGGIGLEVLKEGGGDTYLNMLTDYFIHMAENASTTESTIPETLSFDRVKLVAISNDFTPVALICTALTALKINFNRLYSAQYVGDAIAVTMELVERVEAKIKNYHIGDFEEVIFRLFVQVRFAL